MDILTDASTISAHDQLVLVVQVLAACLAGGIVGLERELAGKRAGIRTHMVVAVAAALAVGIGRIVAAGSGAGDPTRVFHGLLTGIGFIGAGAIITNVRPGTTGLTTAATILLVAVLGAVSAFGAPFLALGGAVFALMLLRGLVVVERPLRFLTSKFHGDEDEAPDGV